MNNTVGAISSPNFGATLTQLTPTHSFTAKMHSVNTADPTQNNFIPSAQMRSGSVASETQQLSGVELQVAKIAQAAYRLSQSLVSGFQSSNASYGMPTGFDQQRHSLYAIA